METILNESDSRPRSVLELSGYTAKLGDFGLSTYIESSTSVGCAVGSMNYCSPEELCGGGGVPSDIWSLGCVLYALLTGAMPFADDFVPRLQTSIKEGRWEAARLEGRTVGVRKLVAGMLKVEVGERSAMEEVLRSDWVLGR
jgi:serine/threonine protein kinase